MAENDKNYVSNNPTLLAEWNFEKNDKLGITPDKITCGSGKKVWWQCEKSHEWEATIVNRTNGSGCPICVGKKILIGYNDLATTNPQLASEWHPTKNGNLNPTDVTQGSHKIVWWKCAKGHEWQANLYDRTNGNRCPICAGKKNLIGFNDLATTKPQLASEWHPTKNGNLKPTDVTSGSNKKVWWQCKKGHEWQATVANRSNNRGCPICSGEMKTSFPEQALLFYFGKVTQAENRYLEYGKEIDVFLPTLNIGIEYNGAFYHKDKKRDLAKVQFLAQKGVKIITIAEGEQNAVNGDVIEYAYHSSNRQNLEWAIKQAFSLANLNCPVIDIETDTPQIHEQYIILEKENSLLAKHPQLASEWHPTKNGSLKPTDVTQSSGKKVWWRCEKGHEWMATINRRNSGIGCPICSGHKSLAGYNDLATTNPQLASEWHPTKNGNLKPTDVTQSSGKKVWWQCEKGHEWEIRVADRNNGKGCPICKNKEILVGYNDLATTNPQIANEWHPTKNGNLKPTDVVCGSGKKVWWQCEKGHEWQARIADRNIGIGCPFCSNRKVSAGFNDLATTNPRLIKEWHPTKNGELNPTDVTKGSHKKFWWQCAVCGNEWQATVEKRAKRNQGCPECAKSHKGK